MRIIVFLTAMLLAGQAWAEVYMPATGHSLSYTTTSTTMTGTTGRFVDVIRIVVSTDAFVAISSTQAGGIAAVAFGATSVFLPSDTPEYFKVPALAHIAVRASDTDGRLFIQEMTK